LAAGLNLNIPVTLDFGSAEITYWRSFSSQMGMSEYQNGMLATQSRVNSTSKR